MSSYSEGQTHLLMEALESAGFTATEVTLLGQAGKKRLNEIRNFLAGKAEIVMKKVEEVVVSLLAIVKTITQPAASAKKTADRFKDKSLFWDPDPDLVVWLPEMQPAQSESNFSVFGLTQNATSKQAVESYLGLGDTPTEVLSNLLKERGCTTTLPVIESLIERQENKEDVGLRIDGWANFFFVEDANGGVSVVRAVRNDGQWYVRVRRLGFEGVWLPEGRFFFRNQTL